MLASGHISEDYIPYVDDIYVVGKEGKLIALPKVVLDTGFNDQFCLPKSFKDQCELKYVGDIEYILGDGSVIQESTFEGQIIINKQPFFAVISFTDDDEALLGTALLSQRIVTINFIEKSVTIK